MKTALLLIAHGSRHAEANADLLFLVEELRRANKFAIVQEAFLELASPDIEQGVRVCIAGGAERIILVPYFLSAGLHVRRDLEKYYRQLAGAFPRVRFSLAQPLGRHPLLVDVVTLRAQDAAGNEDNLY